MNDLFDLTAYEYDLPKELIASSPLEKRDDSRLMLVDRASGNLSEMPFGDLLDWTGPGDQFIFNDTKVIKARLQGKKETGANVEIFLLKNLEALRWEVLCKPGRKVKEGHKVVFGDAFYCEVEQTLESGNKIVRFHSGGNFDELLQKYGSIPLPHYMGRDAAAEDEERYQTVYAKEKGALAAPTAGLHFTREMLEGMRAKGVDLQTITLHVGWGTFKPVQVQDIRSHNMHTESFKIDASAADRINSAWTRQICVGTTTCRALESRCQNGRIFAGEGETDIFIYPSYEFKFVKTLLTNFHLPGSSLMMLVSAFGGYDLIREAYKKAVKDRYRFYSYGDAMLIL
jgi:S-adenosylmethionine:tRNA ribosyltransferase-isomerase